jgi:hypothetical protein
MTRPTWCSCPKCGARHRGPRATELLFDEGRHVLANAQQMPLKMAAEYLRSQWMGGALELSGWCSSCIFTQIAATATGRKDGELDEVSRLVAAALPTPAEIERAYVEGSMHPCKVVPLFPSKEKVARDLLDIGSPKGDAS